MPNTLIETKSKLKVKKENTEKKHKKYSLRIGPYLLDRINQIVSSLKRTRPAGYSRQTWIENALREKLKEDREEEDIILYRQTTFLFEEKLFEDIEKRLEKIRRKHPRFSKRKWINISTPRSIDQGRKKAIQSRKNSLS